MQALKNLPGSFHHLFEITARKYQADFVLVDLSPGLGSVNQNLVATANFFLVPTSPDIFSVMAIDSLARVVPRWITWAERAAQLQALAGADYPFPALSLKFLGIIVQRYRLRSGAPTQGFERYFERLQNALTSQFLPALNEVAALLPDDAYEAAAIRKEDWLASIPDFNTLIADSQAARKPVFALTKEDVQRVGRVWETTNANIQKFRATFDELATRIESLTSQ